uniref:Venom protein 4 n=1 Tax=Microctonus hyperodae TaxID=165561 RepID=A9YME2_MICHY|nr:venom protein 4 [Microctonus hyperodae]
MKINTQTRIILLAFIYIPNVLVHANAINKINSVEKNMIVEDNSVKIKRESPVFNEDLSLQVNNMKLIKPAPEEIIHRLHILEKRNPVDTPESSEDEDNASNSNEQNMEGAAAHEPRPQTSGQEYLQMLREITGEPPSYRELYDAEGGEDNLNRPYPPSYNSIFHPEEADTWFDKWIEMTMDLEKFAEERTRESLFEKVFGKSTKKIRMEGDAVEAGPSGWTPQSASIERSQEDRSDELRTSPPYESIFNLKNNQLDGDSDEDSD